MELAERAAQGIRQSFGFLRPFIVQNFQETASNTNHKHAGFLIFTSIARNPVDMFAHVMRMCAGNFYRQLILTEEDF